MARTRPAVSAIVAVAVALLACGGPPGSAGQALPTPRGQLGGREPLESTQQPGVILSPAPTPFPSPQPTGSGGVRVPPAPASPSSAATVAARSAVRVRAWRGGEPSESTGWVWDDGGHVVAASEAVEGADAVDVATADGEWVEAAPVGSDPASGIAVVRAPGAATPPLALPFAGVAPGDRVVVVGSPSPGGSGRWVFGTVLDPADGVWRVDLPPGAAWSPGAPIVGGSGLVGMALRAGRAGGVVSGLDDPGKDTAGEAVPGSAGPFVPAARLRRVVPALIDRQPIGTPAPPARNG